MLLLGASSHFYPTSPSSSTASGQPALGHAHFPRLPAAIFIPWAPFDSSGMKLPLKKGAAGRCSPPRGSPAPLGRSRRAGSPRLRRPKQHQHHGLLWVASSPAQAGESTRISPFLSVDVVILIIKVVFFAFFFFLMHTHGGCRCRWQEGSAPRGCRRGSSAPWPPPSHPSPRPHRLSCTAGGQKCKIHGRKSKGKTHHEHGSRDLRRHCGSHQRLAGLGSF